MNSKKAFDLITRLYDNTQRAEVAGDGDFFSAKTWLARVLGSPMATLVEVASRVPEEAVLDGAVATIDIEVTSPGVFSLVVSVDGHSIGEIWKGSVPELFGSKGCSNVLAPLVNEHADVDRIYARDQAEERSNG